MAKKQLTFPQQAARFSCYAPVAAVGIRIITLQAEQETPFTGVIVGGLNIFLITLGFLFAIYALFSMFRNGQRGILGYAIIGLPVNGLLVVAIIFSFQNVASLAELNTRSLTKEEATEIPNLFEDSQVLYDEEIGYRIEIPPGFEVPPIENPAFKYTYTKLNEGEPNPMVLGLQHLGGRIGRNFSFDDDAFRSRLPPGTELKAFTVQWDDKKLPAAQIKMLTVNGPVTSYVVQVPLAREAIQINFGGLNGHDEATRLLFEKILSSLHGKSNWK